MSETLILTLRIGSLSTNCYIVGVRRHECVIIDPGDDFDYIIDKCKEFDLIPTAILATHGHFDHIGAASTLSATFKVPFFIHPKDEFLVKRMRSTAIHFGEEDPGPTLTPNYDFPKKITFGGLALEVIETPGHTPGSVSYLLKDEAVFSGDLFFADGTRGEVTHQYSNPIKLSESIEKIKSFSGITIYPGHGEAFIV